MDEFACAREGFAATGVAGEVGADGFVLWPRIGEPGGAALGAVIDIAAAAAAEAAAVAAAVAI